MGEREGGREGWERGREGVEGGREGREGGQGTMGNLCQINKNLVELLSHTYFGCLQVYVWLGSQIIQHFGHRLEIISHKQSSLYLLPLSKT